VPTGTYVVASTTTGGPPTVGTWVTGQSYSDKNGILWDCTAGGTPGTWAEAVSTSRGTINLATFPGVTSGADCTVAILAACVAAQGTGPAGTNLEILIPPGFKAITSSPIPLYNGFRMRGSYFAQGTLNQSSQLANATTDIFSYPTGASGILRNVTIRGIYFSGLSSSQSTHWLTPQPVDSSGWVAADFIVDGCSWQFFRSVMVGSFSRPRIREYNISNGSHTSLGLFGADGEIGGPRSYIDGMPTSNTWWIYIGAVLSGTPSPSAYSSGSTYATGNVVVLGGVYFQALQSVPAATPPPGSS
jgi:hypothetical protein